MSMAISGSSSMMSTSVATCWAISRPAWSTRLADLRFRLAENVGDLGGGEILHRHQQERLAGQRRDRLQPLRRVVELVGIELLLREVDLDGVPVAAEGLEQLDPRIVLGIEGFRIGNQRLENGDHIGVPALLPPGQRPREAAQIGQMRCGIGDERHSRVPGQRREDGVRDAKSQRHFGRRVPRFPLPAANFRRALSPIACRPCKPAARLVMLRCNKDRCRAASRSIPGAAPLTYRVIPVPPFDYVVFGGTGDLARRKLLPVALLSPEGPPDPRRQPHHRRVAPRDVGRRLPRADARGARAVPPRGRPRRGGRRPLPRHAVACRRRRDRRGGLGPPG